MVHIAYDVKNLLKALPVKIESVAFWETRLLISCIDGSLRIYSPYSPDDDDSEKRDAIRKSDNFTLEDTLIGFSKKPVSRMEVLQSRNLLITLSDAVIVHKLPGFEVFAYLAKTKGASLYAWDGKQGVLCAAKQKRLIIFQHTGRDFSEVKELAAPDIVRSIAWCGDSLCLGIGREYVILNTTTGNVIDLFPCGRIASPSIVPLPNGELLLGKDNVGVFIDQHGKLTHPGGITWSEVPSVVVINRTYALAWLSRFIEVRYLDSPHTLVQMLPLRDMQLLPSGGHFIASGSQVIVASDSAVHALLSVPVGAQIVQLTASRSFDEALVLCKLLPSEDAALRAAKEDDIHKRYAQFLLKQQEYEKSMQHFAESSLDITAVLSLFPSIKLPKFCQDSSFEILLESSFVGSELSDTLEDHLQPSMDLEEVEGGVNKESLQVEQTVPAMNALAGFLMNKRAKIVEKAEAEDTAAAVAAMVSGPTRDFKRSKSSTKYADAGTDKIIKYGARDTAIMLDTALIQALLLSRQSTAALQLLREPNYCDIDSCEAMMLQGLHFMELLQLYKNNGLHRKALDLLNRLAVEKETIALPSEGDEQFGSEAIIDYLKKLGGQDPFLILDSSVWLLKTCPEKAVSSFTSMDPPLPANIVNKYLKEKFPELQGMYLEHLLAYDKSLFSAGLQNELVHIYLERILEERSQLQAQGIWDEHQHTEVREKLLTLLKNSTDYTSESLLKRLPADGLHEEKAILLGQMGQHQLALTLYVHKLHEPELALKYCDGVLLASTTRSKDTFSKESATALKQPIDKAALNIYLTLLKVYLNPSAAVREYDRSVTGLDFTKKFPSQRIGIARRGKGHVAKKIAKIEGAEESRQSFSSNESLTDSRQNFSSNESPTDSRQNFSSNESAADSGKSDGEDLIERSNQITEEVMLDEALNLLSCRWDRIDAAQALHLLPSDTKLQRLFPFLEPLLHKSNEARHNLSVIRSLRQSENLQVQYELQQCRKRVVKVTGERTCFICHKRIGNSVFAVYPTGTLVHFVCHKDQKPDRALASPIIDMY